MTFKDQAPVLSHKTLISTNTKILDEELGIVEAFVAGIGNKDSVKDIIQPGAFDDSLEAMKPKGVWSHDWNRPVSKTLEIYEVPAGDSRLPEKMKVAGIGGLYVKTQFNLETQDGRDAFSWVKFYGEESEWSIGYQTIDEEWDKKAKANLLHKVKLYEYSPVLFGANPLTATVGVKVVLTNSEDGTVKIKIEGVEDDVKREALTELVKSALEGATETTSDEAEATDGEKAEGAEGTTDTEAVAAKEAEGEGTTLDDEVEGSPEVTDELVTAADEKADDSETSEKDDEEPAEEQEGEEGDTTSDADDEEGDDEGDAEGEEAEKALNPVVESFMTYAEKSTFTAQEAKSLTKFVSERIEEKAVAGSVEERLRKLSSAIEDEFGGDYGYTYLYATFDGSVIFYSHDYKAGESGYYEASYSVNDEGEVEFGEAKEVDVVEVVVAKHAVMEAAFKGHAASVKSILAPLVDVSASSEEDQDVKNAVVEGLEAKVGKKLSKKTRGLIEEAFSALEKVLDFDGSADSEEKETEVDSNEEKSIDTEVEENPGQETEEKAYVVEADELEDLQALAKQYLKSSEED